MTLTDPIADLITRIRNAQLVRKAKVSAPDSKVRRALLDVLVREGYILGYDVRHIRPGINEINIELKYVDGTPVIQEIKRVSKPGRRVYSRADRLPKFYNGLGISVLTTAKGILSDREARSQSLGGEIMCTVF